MDYEFDRPIPAQCLGCSHQPFCISLKATLLLNDFLYCPIYEPPKFHHSSTMISSGDLVQMPDEEGSWQKQLYQYCRTHAQ